MRTLLLFHLLLFLLPVKSQVTDGLVAKYSFNNGDNREELSGRHIKAVGATLAEDRFGNPGSAYFLHGNEYSYLNLGTDKILKPSAITISLWIKIEAIMHKGNGVPFNPIIITKSNPTNDFFEAYFVGLNMQTQNININTAIGVEKGVGLTSTAGIDLRKWYHVVMAFDDRYLWLYINGVLQNDNKPMLKNFRSHYLETDSVIVGSLANKKNNRSLQGTVDDILFYNRALSTDEVIELYNAPDPDKNRIYYTWFYRALVLFLIVAITAMLLVRRYKLALRKEKEKNWVNIRLLDLETKAIRTQMNPHFMFNSLNTLQRFILEEDIKGAHNYLSKFSKLLRKILESSTSDSIQLSEEIEILQQYIEIERLRFNHSFDYSISSTISNPEGCYIPFLLIQPFVENAIWHGLLPLRGHRFLSITFSSPTEHTILCVIEDNGVGMEYSARRHDPLKKKSLAIDFIKQRLELLEKSKGIPCAFKIIDKKDNEAGTGTRVEISIPKLN